MNLTTRPSTVLLRLLFCVCVTACSSTNAQEGAQGPAHQAEESLQPVADAATNNANDNVEAEELDFINFEQGDPASVYWSAASNALYIADNEANRIWRWTDAGGLKEYAVTAETEGQLEAGATNVGQLIETADGTLIVARFGKPRAGFSGIAWVTKEGETGMVPVADENVKRLGLTQTSKGKLFGSFFAHPPEGSEGGPRGSVTSIDLKEGEEVIAEGFGKLIGVAASSDSLFVSDQSAGIIYSAPLEDIPAAAGDWKVVARLPVPDQICLGANGSLFSGQFQAAPGSTEPTAIRQISADGVVTVFATDPLVAKPSGVSYDAKGKRLFAADAGNAAEVGVHIFRAK